MNSSPRLDCRGIGKIFPLKKEEPVTALENISFQVGAGQIVGLLGPDGAGKSTLIRLATGLMRPTSGIMTVLGWNTISNAASIQQSIGYMPQKFGLYEDLTVQENLNLYASLHDVQAKIKQERMEHLLRMTDLLRFTPRLAGKLSGGMKQKLALVCTLISSPELILLDEPTVGVDPLSRREIWTILRRLTEEERLSVLVSTAYMDEALYCHRTLILYNGHVLKEASPADIAEEARGKTFTIGTQTKSQWKPRQIQSLLLHTPDVINASLYAEGVRLVMPPESPHFEKLSRWNPIPSEPDFSDGFMTLLFNYLRQKGYEENSTTHSPVPEEQHPSPMPKAASAGTGENNTSDIVVDVRHLIRKFGEFIAVNDVSFHVKRGEIFGLLGPNGAGKSTTFYMLCGLLPPSGGSLNVAGVDLRTAAPYARRKIGYMAQKFSQYGNLTVLQNLDFSAGAYGMKGVLKKQRISETMDEFDLHRFAHLTASRLPGGYKQRLGMACALLHSPDILFLDEPTSGADPLARREFWIQIGQLADKGVTVIITTHFMDEAEYCDNMIIMMDGMNLAQGSPDDIRNSIPHDKGKPPSLEEAFIAITEKRLQTVSPATS